MVTSDVTARLLIRKAASFSNGGPPSAAFAVACWVALQGCGSGMPVTTTRQDSIIYGPDNRLQYFEVSDPVVRSRVADSTVALIANHALDGRGSRLRAPVPSWGEVANLCEGEPFAEEPAVAFCTGVLVDWDLVLTAGHCLRVATLEDFSVVFGYYYDAPDRLAMTVGDIVAPVEIVREALASGDTPGLDYGWLRLARPVAPPLQPVPVHTRAPLLVPGAGVTSIGAGNGAPMKVDGTARVQAAASSDYFVANTDTSGGWSGGGAFDDDGALIGVLARGGTDLVTTVAGCQSTVRVRDADAEEEFTYAHRAIEELCAADPQASTVCRADCPQPCLALPSPLSGAGCTVGPPGDSGPISGGALFLFAATGLVWPGLRRRPRRGANAEAPKRDPGALWVSWGVLSSKPRQRRGGCVCSNH
jgi:hypothetical protein